jgi:hypothetical protein
MLVAISIPPAAFRNVLRSVPSVSLIVSCPYPESIILRSTSGKDRPDSRDLAKID